MEQEGTWCTWVGGKCPHNNKPSCREQSVIKCRNLRDRNEAAAKEKECEK